MCPTVCLTVSVQLIRTLECAADLDLFAKFTEQFSNNFDDRPCDQYNFWRILGRLSKVIPGIFPTKVLDDGWPWPSVQDHRAIFRFFQGRPGLSIHPHRAGVTRILTLSPAHPHTRLFHPHFSTSTRLYSPKQAKSPANSNLEINNGFKTDNNCFWTVRARALIFHMYISLDKTFQLEPKIWTLWPLNLTFELLFKDFNFGHNFWTIRARSFVLPMYFPSDKIFPFDPKFWPCDLWPWPLSYFWKTLTLAITSEP